GFLAADGVTVHVEDLGERVIATDLLQLLERRTDHVRVDETDSWQCFGVSPQLTRGSRRLRRVVGDLHLVHAVRRTGRVDIGLDVAAFLVRLVGSDAEVLYG